MSSTLPAQLLLRTRVPVRHLRHSRPKTHPHRTLIAPPNPASGPLMDRRANRALPELSSPYTRWLKTLPLFLAIIGASTLAIFNYQKTSSSVVNATLYALRTHPRAKELLGEEIYFRDKFPWIWGELNQLHGRIDIGFGVKGKQGKGFMRFKSVRRSRLAYFETLEWSLELEDRTMVQLLQEEGDPFKNTELQAAAKE